MPTLRVPSRLPGTRPSADPPGVRRRSASVVVLGDLVLDVVLAPEAALARGTDVPGRVQLRQGGSAATTARWLARLGVATRLVCSVGRDASGRSLVHALAADGVDVRAIRPAGVRTGRIGVVVEPSGERSFVADRDAADALRPDDVRPGWITRAALLHLPAYSLLGRPLGEAGLAATRVAHEAGALVTVDLASVGPLLAGGRRAALAVIRDARPDLVFATAAEAAAMVGGSRIDRLLDVAPVVILKRGADGAAVLARDGAELLRFDVATTQRPASDTTGAGDAFDAGFIAGWLAARAQRGALASVLRRAVVAGNRAAARHLDAPRAELDLG